MSDTKALLSQERAASAKLRELAATAAEQAAARGERFNPTQWAAGVPQNFRYPMGAPWQPIVKGVPTFWRSLWGMNAYDFTTILASGGITFAATALFRM